MAEPWFHAAEKMVGDACLIEYRKANPIPGRKHNPYVVPDWCKPLLNAAHAGDEHETKRIMHVVRMGCFTLV